MNPTNSKNSPPIGVREWLSIILIVGLLFGLGTIIVFGNFQPLDLVATSTATKMPTSTQTSTPTSTPTRTPTNMPTPTSTPTNTPIPTLLPRPSGKIVPTIFVTAGEVISGTPVPTQVPIVDQPQDMINILMLGTDRRPGDSGYRTDSIIVVSVNPKQQYVTLL